MKCESAQRLAALTHGRHSLRCAAVHAGGAALYNRDMLLTSILTQVFAVFKVTIGWLRRKVSSPGSWLVLEIIDELVYTFPKTFTETANCERLPHRCLTCAYSLTLTLSLSLSLRA